MAESLITQAHWHQPFLDAIAAVLAKAAESRWAPADLDPIRFHLGLAVLNRPLSPTAAGLAPELADWLTGAFIDGLRAAARRDG